LATQVAIEAENVRILATSRRRLATSEEFVIDVGGLGVPELGENSTLEELATWPAIALFLQSARSSSRDYSLTLDNASDTVKLVQALDGLPLSIELAAARLKLVPLKSILAMLEEGLHILSSPHRPQRQQRVSEIVEWSMSDLSGPARFLLNALAFFGAGWNLEAAKAVVNDAAYALDELLDHSLVFQMPDHRFRILESIRPVILGHLDADERDQFREAHLRAYLAIYEAHKEWASGPEIGVWRRQVQADMPNLRLALQWAATRPDADQAGERLACAIWRFWNSAGSVGEGHRLILGLVAGHREQPRNAVYAELLSALARLVMRQGLLREARAFQTQALEIFRGLGDARAEAENCFVLAEIGIRNRESEESERLFKDGLRLFEAIGDEVGMGDCLNGIGRALTLRNKYVEAVKYYQLSLSMLERSGKATTSVAVLNNLGDSLMELGELAKARGYFELALPIAKSTENQVSYSIILENLGLTSVQLGELKEARRFHTESLSIRRSIGDFRNVARSELNLGLVSFGEGEFGEAERLFASAITTFDQLGESYEASIPRLWTAEIKLSTGDAGSAVELVRWALGVLTPESAATAKSHALLVSAQIVLEQGRFGLGAVLLGASEAVRARHGMMTPRMERKLAERGLELARRTLKNEFEGKLEEGRLLTDEEALQTARRAIEAL
jgi:predicted ATPase